jgi:pimeloyl-ACP methyl ester carboxylesterase
MSKLTSADGVDVLDKDQGRGQPVVFRHGGALRSDGWEPQPTSHNNLSHRRRSTCTYSHPWWLLP